MQAERELPRIPPPTRTLSSTENTLVQQCQYLFDREYQWNPTTTLGLYVCVHAMIYVYSYNLNRQAQGLRLIMEDLMKAVEADMTKEQRHVAWHDAASIFRRDFRDRLERAERIQEEEFSKGLLKEPGSPAAQERIKNKLYPFDKITDREQEELLKRKDEWEKRFGRHFLQRKAVETPHHVVTPPRKEVDISKLMEGVTNSQECGKRALDLVDKGKPKEGYHVLLEGMRRFEGQKPSLLPIYTQFMRGHISE